MLQRNDDLQFLFQFNIPSCAHHVVILEYIFYAQTHAYTDNPDIVLCGNKADLDEQRVVTEQQAKETATRFGCASYTKLDF